MTDQRKQCPHCGLEKPHQCFHASSKNRGGLASWCKQCVADRRRERWSNPEYRERELAKARARWDRDKARARTLRQYDMTTDDYAALFEFQLGVCAICEKPPKAGRNLQVDHDHKTGLIRGLLCGHCNYQLLGAFHEDVRVFQNAAMYLAQPLAEQVIGERYHVDAPPRKDSA